METTKDLVKFVLESWLGQEHEDIVKNYVILLGKALEADEAEFAPLETSPTEASIAKAPSYVEDFNQEGSTLELVVRDQWLLLPWTNPDFFGTSKFDDVIKMVELVRTAESSLKLIYMKAGTTLPQNAKNARELVHICSGDSSAKIGAIEEWITEISSKRFYEFSPTAPQVIKASEDAPLLYLSFWDVKDVSKTKFWFANHTKGQTYTKDIMAIQNVEDYYNKMASDYEESMFGWGYCMPEAIADALVRHGGLQMEASILDLGCGNGLCGQALYNRGIKDINGIDFSSEMLKQCAKRACYNTLQKHDLLTPLPFEEKRFDCLISVAVTTYLNPSVLKLWLRVAKIGALISFTHKTSVWSQWESEQNAMEDGGLWSKVWVSNPIPYLPSLKEGQDNNTEPCQEMAKVYIYKKL